MKIGNLLFFNYKAEVGMRAKKGEVVVPAGGETGLPHCLAEVRKLLRSFISLFCCVGKDAIYLGKKRQIKNENKF